MFTFLRREVAMLVTYAALTTSSTAGSTSAANRLTSDVGAGGTTIELAVQPTLLVPVMSGVILVCLGMLLGASWTTQALQAKLRQHAEERRRLNEQWSAVRTARQQRRKCPRCASPLSERDWYIAVTLVKDPPNDDD